MFEIQDTGKHHHYISNAGVFQAGEDADTKGRRQLGRLARALCFGVVTSVGAERKKLLGLRSIKHVFTFHIEKLQEPNFPTRLAKVKEVTTTWSYGQQDSRRLPAMRTEDN